jgi:hypothetical protein
MSSSLSASTQLRGVGPGFFAVNSPQSVVVFVDLSVAFIEQGLHFPGREFGMTASYTV